MWESPTEISMRTTQKKRTLRTIVEAYWPRMLFGLLLLTSLWYLVRVNQKTVWGQEPEGPLSIVVDSDNKKHIYYSQTHPFIFIGGHPRSGTTLMRAMLDAHSWVRCAEETRILPNVVEMRSQWEGKAEKPRLLQGGMTAALLDRALAAFVLETIAQHGPPAKVLCNKDPLLLKSGAYLARLFPRSKWLFMVRDGRAVVHSIVSRKITITGYSNEDPEKALQSWNLVVEQLQQQCHEVGMDRCLKVHYEQLVLHPRRTMQSILEFLELPWDEAVLHHNQFINKEGDHGIRVSVRERSSDQIVKPINVNALTRWVGSFPAEVVANMETMAPMLARLGYDPRQNPPAYGVPDKEVIQNTRELAEHEDLWVKKVEVLMKEMKKNY